MRGQVIVDNLSKIYRSKQRRGLFRSTMREVTALRQVTLTIEPGEIFGLLGPNGAGKTTLIKCLTTLLLPTSGSARVNGFELLRQDDAIRATVGCMLMGERGLYWKLTGRENLVFFGALYHLSPAVRRQRAETILERLDMVDLADRAVETYSSGQKMKLAFAKALINDAPVLVLDEPTNTLDVPSARELRAIVRALNDEGRTIIYTTHIMSEAEALCDRVAIIDRGEVIALDTVAALKQSLHREHVIRLDGVFPERSLEAVRRLGGVDRAALATVNGSAQLTVVAARQDGLLPRLVDALTGEGAMLQRIAPDEVTLEDVFITRTGRSLSEDTRVQ